MVKDKYGYELPEDQGLDYAVPLIEFLPQPARFRMFPGIELQDLTYQDLGIIRFRIDSALFEAQQKLRNLILGPPRPNPLWSRWRVGWDEGPLGKWHLNPPYGNQAICGLTIRGFLGPVEQFERYQPGDDPPASKQCLTCRRKWRTVYGGSYPCLITSD